jgi:hypothetical protein
MNKPEPTGLAVKAGEPLFTTKKITARGEPTKNSEPGEPQPRAKKTPTGATQKVQAEAETKPAATIQPTADRFPALEPQEGVLTYYDPTAKVVEVAGDFNGWHPEANPLAATGFGEWNVQLTLRPGQYEYRFWVDGAWADDPRARQSTPNPYGGHNALLKVGLDDRVEFL